MFKIYYQNALTTKERFHNAFIAGSLTAIGCIIINALFIIQFNVVLSPIYLLYAYLIGTVIKKTGHGVQNKFIILAITLIILTMFFGEMLAVLGFNNILNFDLYDNAITSMFKMIKPTPMVLMWKTLAISLVYKTTKIV